MTITMQELAQMAGVSRSTVDRALNSRGRVNSETKERICQLAKQMGYEPDLAAKTLASKSKPLKIGCILNSGGNSFFHDVEKGIDSAAKELEAFNVRVITRAVEHLDVTRQLEIIDELLSEGIQAVAITPLNTPEIAGRLNELISNGIAVVALTADITGVDYLSYVGCNHIKSGRITANMAGLIAKDTAKILFVLGSKSLLGHSQRLLGFEQVMNERYKNMKIEDVIETQDDDFISYNKIYNYLSSHSDIDLVIFAASGSKGGIRAILDLEYPCRIITFDMTSHNRRYLEEDIISCVICQEPYMQGYHAVKILSDHLLLGKKLKSNRFYTKTEIFVRDSL